MGVMAQKTFRLYPQMGEKRGLCENATKQRSYIVVHGDQDMLGEDDCKVSEGRAEEECWIRVIGRGHRKFQLCERRKEGQTSLEQQVFQRICVQRDASRRKL